jgi:hypothetical protein
VSARRALPRRRAAPGRQLLAACELPRARGVDGRSARCSPSGPGIRQGRDGVEGAVQPPKTRYARLQGDRIAYQVLGEGPPDLVLCPGSFGHLDIGWEDPGIALFCRTPPRGSWPPTTTQSGFPPRLLTQWPSSPGSTRPCSGKHRALPSTRSRPSWPASTAPRRRRASWRRSCSPTSWTPPGERAGWGTGAGGSCWTSTTSWPGGWSRSSAATGQDHRRRHPGDLRRARPSDPLCSRPPGRAGRHRRPDPGRAAHRRGGTPRRRRRRHRRPHRRPGDGGRPTWGHPDLQNRPRARRGLRHHPGGPWRTPLEGRGGQLAAVRGTAAPA